MEITVICYYWKVTYDQTHLGNNVFFFMIDTLVVENVSPEAVLEFLNARI